MDNLIEANQKLRGPSEQCPEQCIEGYKRLLRELVHIFSLDKRSGKVELHFLEGIPKEIKCPSFCVRLDK